MAQKEENRKQQIEDILSRLTTVGVQVDEQERKEIEDKFSMFVDEYRIPIADAIRTITITVMQKHGIKTKYWSQGGKAPVYSIDQVKADNEWVSLKAKVVQIWDNNNDAIALTGLIGDESGVIKFTIFARNKNIIPDGFEESKSYTFENVVSSIWNGQISVKVNKTTTITACDDVVTKRIQTMTGVIISVSSGSGLIKRCPDCKRVLVKGMCGEHGKVEGKYDLRIKAIFSPFGGNEQFDLIIAADPIEELTGLSVDKAREMAAEALDGFVIEDRFRAEITGRYYEVTGSTLLSGMFVESIKPIDISSQEALAEALKEAEVNQ